MSNQVNVAHVQQYTTNVRFLAQQMGSRLRDKVMVQSCTGKAAVAVEQIGTVTPVLLATRHADSPMIDTPHARRWVHPKDYAWGDMVDRQDAVRMLIDPKSPYARAGAEGMNRRIDADIIAAFNATAYVGENGSTTEAFDTTNQQILHGSVGMTMTKLRQVVQKFRANEVDASEPIYMVLGSKQILDLLNETQMISLDYGRTPVLEDPVQTGGMVLKPFGGIAGFIHSEQLPLSSTTRSCFAFVPSGMCLGLWEDITANAAIRPDKNFNYYLHNRMTIGATRTENKRVVEVQATEA